MSEVYKYRFSIFTATYNRAQYLPEVYKCLLRQSYKDFEWVVVDDGSTDNTEQICKQFVADGLIPIKYIRKRNGGKHTAWKEATKVFEGKYVMCADDDDLIPSDALAVFNRKWEELEKQANYDDFWEIRACVQLPDGRINTPALPTDPFDSDYIEVNYKFGFQRAEMHGCRKVEVLRGIAAVPDHFVFEEECSNFSESIRWIRAARKYKTRFVRDVVRVYVHRNGESLCAENTGSNRSTRRTYNSVVGELYALNEQRDILFKYNLKEYFQRVFLLAYHSMCLNKLLSKWLHFKIDKALFFLSLPAACVLFYFRER